MQQDTVLESTASGNVEFHKRVDGDGNGPWSLTVNTGGNTDFGDGGADYVGNTFALASLTTDAPGTTRFDVTPSDNTNQTVTTIGNQIYNDAVLLDATTVLHGDDVTFNNTVDSVNEENALTVKAGHTATFDRKVGDSALPPSDVTVTAEKKIVINDNFTTSGTITFDAKVEVDIKDPEDPNDPSASLVITAEGDLKAKAGDKIIVHDKVTMESTAGSIVIHTGNRFKLEGNSADPLNHNAKIVAKKGSVKVEIGTADENNVSIGLIRGSITTDGTAVQVEGNNSSDTLEVDLNTASLPSGTASLPSGGLDFNGGGQPAGAQPADTLRIEADDVNSRDFICITDSTGRIKWRKHSNNANPILFDYVNTETVDLRTNGGDDQIKVTIDPGRVRKTTFKLDAGPDTGAPDKIYDALMIEAKVGVANRAVVVDLDDVTGDDVRQKGSHELEEAFPDVKVGIDWMADRLDADPVVAADETAAFELVRNEFKSVNTYNIFAVRGLETLQMLGDTGNDWWVNSTKVPSLITGNAGMDVLWGGDANKPLGLSDVLNPSNPDRPTRQGDVLVGGSGRDAMFGNDGDDFLYADHTYFPNDLNIVGDKPRIEKVDPTDANEFLNGGMNQDGTPDQDWAVAFDDRAINSPNFLGKGGHIDIVMWLTGRLAEPTDGAIDEVWNEALGLPWMWAFDPCPAGSGGTLGKDPPLGTVDFRHLTGQDVSGEDLVYSLETTHRGYLTVEAAFDAGSGSLQAELYDANEDLLVSSTPTATGLRLDWQVESGEFYFVKLVGTSADFDLTVVNLLDYSGTTVTVDGTAGDDTFTFDASASGRVVVNGVEYKLADNEAVDTVTFSGNAGHDTIVIFDSPGDDSLVAGPDSIAFVGDSGAFSLNATGMELMQAYAKAGGNDSAELHGSASYDKFKSVPESGYAKMYGGPVYLRAKFFETVDAYSGGGNDLARFFDSAADDVFEGQRGMSRLYGGQTDVTVHDFSRVFARAGQGGNDVAKLTDSALKDELHAKPHKTEIFDTVTGGDVYKVSARGFSSVSAQATQGGYDKAKLWDTGVDDLLEATGDRVKMSRNGESLDLLYEVMAFEFVKGRSVNGGNDTSAIDGPLAVDLVLEGDWDQ